LTQRRVALDDELPPRLQPARVNAIASPATRVKNRFQNRIV
jgi:hypothetical protein